ncbi:cytochrome c-type biogenesis protein H1 [Salmonella enterica subsp. enterica]|uniref:Cytochrome c-type biogenesis protein H1 n=1 Tax=Salmonella enterica I TaxID=59201 RepID=A0A447N7F8_SALET|nr:cytochrome c-type biogenesis protein H1 [Salmonella enterica subsp. enterica]
MMPAMLRAGSCWGAPVWYWVMPVPPPGRMRTPTAWTRKNSDAALGYAEALTRSSDPEDNRRGGELLRRLVSRDHTDIRVLSLYAFNAFEQQRFGEAVAAWEMMLKLLPADDTRRAVIERSIRLAQEK